VQPPTLPAPPPLAAPPRIAASLPEALPEEGAQEVVEEVAEEVAEDIAEEPVEELRSATSPTIFEEEIELAVPEKEEIMTFASDKTHVSPEEEEIAEDFAAEVPPESAALAEPTAASAEVPLELLAPLRRASTPILALPRTPGSHLVPLPLSQELLSKRWGHLRAQKQRGCGRTTAWLQQVGADSATSPRCAQAEGSLSPKPELGVARARPANSGLARPAPLFLVAEENVTPFIATLHRRCRARKKEAQRAARHNGEHLMRRIS